MTSGPIARAALAALAALALGTGTAQAAGSPFSQLMGLLAKRSGGSVTFVAHTYATGLTRALVSSGELRYRAPDHLEQRTLKPAPSELILDGQRLTVHRDGETRQVNLRAYPEIALYVDALRDTLGGHGEALRRQFAIGWQGTLAHWTLTLQPLQPDAPVRQIRLAGAGADIRRIEILAPHGAKTVLSLAAPSAP